MQVMTQSANARKQALAEKKFELHSHRNRILFHRFVVKFGWRTRFGHNRFRFVLKVEKEVITCTIYGSDAVSRKLNGGIELKTAIVVSSNKIRI